MTEKSQAGQSDFEERNPTSKRSLDAIRHSCAHVMAQAVQEIWPGTKISIGPPIDNGFYYDFDSEHRFTDEDLVKIEARMTEIILGKHDFSIEEVSKEDSMAYWKKRDEPYKIELLEGIEGKVTHCSHDSFIDLCRGGHVDNTKRLRHFKLLSVAGAYWRGDEKNKMLQRIYGTAWSEKKHLKEHLAKLEEAKKRDHRKIGQDMDLFSIQEEGGPGLVFWHPKGGRIRTLIEDWLRNELIARGYDIVYTPHVMKRELWHTSGHADFYSDSMFRPMKIDNVEYQLKPMNCPGHILIYKNSLRSYRDLPLRYAELGTVYRYEKSGTVHGLMRVRGFTQDDAHIFCMPEQVEKEVEDCVNFAKAVLDSFGFSEFKVELSTWDAAKSENYAGSADQWEKAEGALENTLKHMEIPYTRIEGEAAFYGPKIDIKMVDAIGRDWQLTTVQFDFNLPKRFGIEYVAADGSRQAPLMVHRALLGSVERFFGVLIEHYAGKFPLWLAPVQVKVLTINEAQSEPARALAAELKGKGYRVDIDDTNENLKKKIKKAVLEKIPYCVILGPKDVESKTVSIRRRDSKQINGIAPEILFAKLEEEVRSKALQPCLE
ncbi:MAG: threonine--tRNA ligase [Elusimicrobia bacterium]|nr:MAG: threonine--tRNA ligase [Elusimicrobiota bacterium]